MPTQSVLTITDAHDFAQVFINGKLIGSIDRRNHEKTMLLPAMKEGDQLDILVEAMGRINFGRAIKDFKGITEKVELSYTMNTGSQVTVNLKNWQIYTLSDRLSGAEGHEICSAERPESTGDATVRLST